MTPLNYSHLQQQGFIMLLPIINQSKPNQEEALTMWGKEWDNRVIRLEHRHPSNAATDADSKNTEAPFHPQGLEVFIGERNAVDLQYEATIFYKEELESLLTADT